MSCDVHCLLLYHQLKGVALCRLASPNKQMLLRREIHEHGTYTHPDNRLHGHKPTIPASTTIFLRQTHVLSFFLKLLSGVIANRPGTC
jgi:hypothetical protein